MINKKVLFVDDEPNVLQAYTRSLRKKYTITTANNGEEALALLDPSDPFAVIVSDMRMPGMDGVTLLSKTKGIVPDTIRIMLTGNADQQTAIDAVNTGDVFRFLNKPCTPDDMSNAIDLAIEQHRLINAEKSLLEDTVKGSIAALTDVLSLVKPEVFGRTTTYKNLMLSCAKVLEIDDSWELETLAMLSLIGTVSLSDEIVSKRFAGKPISEDELRVFQQHPLLGSAIVEKIPRLEELAQSIKYQSKNFDGSGFPHDSIRGGDIPIGSRLLRVIIDFDNLERAGASSQDIINRFHTQPGIYDPEIISALATALEQKIDTKIIAVSVTQVTDNMLLAEDLYGKDGRLLLCKGQPLSESAGKRLVNFWNNGGIEEKLLVSVSSDFEI